MSRGMDIQSQALQPQFQAASKPQFEVFDQSEFVISQLPKSFMVAIVLQMP